MTATTSESTLETARIAAQAGPRSATGALSLPRVSVATKILYGIGDLSNAIKLAVFGLFTLFFYTSVMGLSGTLVGIATTIGLVWDAAVDPYIGYLSDRLRTRLGRRHLFMLVGSLTMGVSLWLFLSPPRGMTTLQLFSWLLGTTLLVRTTTSIYGVPYFALGAELSQDYNERTSITAIRALIALLGTSAAAALSFVLFFPDGVAGVDPKLNYAGYPRMGLVFGGVMTLAGLVATLGTMRRRGVQRQDEDISQPPSAFFAGFRGALAIRSFRVMFISFSLFYLAIVVNAALSIHYLTYFAGITNSATLSSFQVAFYAGGIGGAVCWLAVARWIDKRWLYMLAGAATAVILLAATLLLGEGRLFAPDSVGVLRAGHALGGWFGSIIWILPWSMMADIADEDELRNGSRREGLLFGVFFFGQQVAAGLSVLLTGILLDSFAGIVPGQAVQAASAASRLSLLFGALPAGLIVIAVLAALRYPLTKSRVERIQASLAHRRAEW